MKNKKLLSIVSAVALTCAIGVTGSYAYLSNNTGEVTNTFTAVSAGLVDPDPVPDPKDPYTYGFDLKEHKANDRSDTKTTVNGVGYNVTLGPEYVQQNTYKFLPGDVGQKDPTVFISKDRKTEVAAYAYVAVKIPENGKVTASVDTTQWKDTNLTTKDGAKVYVYTNGGQTPAVIVNAEGNANSMPEDLAIPVLTDSKYTVANDAVIDKDTQNEQIVIKAYLAQQIDADAGTVFSTVFGSELSSQPSTPSEPTE